MSLFALGWKGWIELRRASRAPKALASQVQHPVAAQTPYGRPRTITLRQLCFKGGTFLASLPRRQFASLTHLSCPIGSVVRVAPDMAAKLLKKVNYEYAPNGAVEAAPL